MIRQGQAAPGSAVVPEPTAVVPERTAVVLGGGGERVTAWQVGVLAGLMDAGFDVRSARVVLGTSAGAWVAARCLALDPRGRAAAIEARPFGLGPPAEPSGSAGLFARLAGVWETAGGGTPARRVVGRIAIEASPGNEDDFVASVTATVPDLWPAAVRLVVTDVAAGEAVVLDATSGVPLGRAVAASRAVPVRCPPVTIDGRSFVDGALGSATQADQVLPDVKNGDVAHVLVVTAAGFGTAAARLWGPALADEVELLRAAGSQVTVVSADAGGEAAMGPDPMSPAGAPLAVAAGRAAGRRVFRS